MSSKYKKFLDEEKVETDEESYDNESCCVCYCVIPIQIEYFSCTVYHGLCTDCFNKISYNLKTCCPLCNAELRNECKSPKNLSKLDIFSLDTTKILQKYVFIHQNFQLDPKFKTLKIKNDCELLEFYIQNGTFAMYDGMFICKDNGFLYTYDEEYEMYHLAVKKGKYQFWDVSRIYRF